MHKEEIDLLIKRSKEFLDAAKERIKKKSWDLACFMAEQAVQLFLKAIILETGGEYPRTHSLRELFAMIGFLTENEIKYDRKALAFLEGAYFSLRYLSITYNEEDARNAIKTAEEVVNIVENVRIFKKEK